ncbi:MAG: molybdopterin-binding protein [Candidatus Methylarchaceae archaeon HK02M1]|nr:molybdopterin-binding protein [Candidatus Methylarchaceae archaeon HK02M1]
MGRAVFKKLVTVEEALEALYEHVKPNPLEVEEVEIKEAYGRILGEDVIARIDLPPFSRAILDGYAVRAIDTSFASETNPTRLRMIGRIPAGELPLLEAKEGDCIEIDTGAFLPKGTDAVVRVEDTSIDGDVVKIYDSVGRGSGIAPMGSDVYHGQFVMSKSEEITAEKVGVLAGLGYHKVDVLMRPHVAIFSTGNELIEPREELGATKIYDVNQYSIGALVQKSGCIPIYLGIKKDEVEEIREAVVEGLRCAHVVIMSGGTSAGVSDLAYKVFDGLGGPGLIVHGIAAKPGKPTIIAAIGDKPIFGLPGFPVSALVIYGLIVDPFLRAMSGKKGEVRRKLKAKLATRHISDRGRREYLPVFLKHRRKALNAVPVLGGSGAIASLSSADGVVEIPENVDLIEKDEIVRVELFSEVRSADIIAVGDSSPISQIILEELRRSGRKVRAEFRGLEHGLTWVRDEIADLLVACIPEDELFDPLRFPSKLTNLRNFKMKMVWASYDKEIFYPGSTFALPRIGSGLRRYAEECIRRKVENFDVIETWSYNASMDLVLNRRAISALLPLYTVTKYDVKFVDAFCANIRYLIRDELLSTRIGKTLLRRIKSKELDLTLSSLQGIS